MNIKIGDKVKLNTDAIAENGMRESEEQAEKFAYIESHPNTVYIVKDIINTAAATIVLDNPILKTTSFYENEVIKMIYTNFYNDFEKLLDFRIMSKEEFLQSYSYLTEEEYDMTAQLVEKNGGANSYEVSKHILDMMRRNDDMLFRCAISHLMDCGIRFLTDENVETTCEEIMKEDDSYSFMTNEYKCAIVRTAAQLARIDHIHLLMYISQNVSYDVGQKEIDYDRLQQIAENVMEWIVSDGSDSSEDYDTFANYCHLDDEEIQQLGFGYLVPEEEEI